MNVKSPAKGTECKFQFSISPASASETMDDFAFKIDFYGSAGVVSLDKEHCIRIDANNYLAIVDTAITGSGRLDARITAHIPDSDCEDGFRTEVAIVSGIETIY